MSDRCFRDMWDAVLVDGRRTDDTNWIPTAKAYVNQSYMKLMAKIFNAQAVEVFTFNTASGTRPYSLPSDFNGLVQIQLVDKAGDTDFATGLQLYAMQKFHERWPSGVSSDNAQPSFVRIKKVEGVLTRNQNATGTEAIQAYSSSALDSTVSVSVLAYEDSARATTSRGMIALGATAGTAGAVSLLKEDGTAMYSYEPFQISKGSYTQGIVTVRRNSTPAVIIGTISPWVKAPEYCTMEFAETPDAVYGIRLEYLRAPMGMMNDSDVPVGFPMQFLEAIEWGAKWRMRDLADDATRTGAAKANAMEWEAQLLASHGKAEVEEFGFTWG